MEVKVLQEGFLEKCSSADDHGKKDWKKRFFVFKHFPASSTKCLEYYKDKNWRKQDPKGVLTLHLGYEVVKVHDPKRRFVFDVKTLEHVFRLATHSEDDLNRWILLLEKENIVKSFVVEPVPGEVMTKINAEDVCHLHIADTEVRLVSANNGIQLVAWPFTCLRRYMSSKGKFSLEAGRRAPTGEGKFTFITSQHDEIYKLLDNVIKSKAGPTGPSRQAPKLRSDSVTSAHAMGEDDSYDHLMMGSVKPAHLPHPNYDQNIIPSLTHKTDTMKSNDYASPYGHMRNRESQIPMTDPDSDFIHSDGRRNIDDYNTLDHNAMKADAFHSTKGQDGYDVLNQTMTKKLPPTPSTYSDLPQSRPTEDFYNTIDANQPCSMGGHAEGGEKSHYKDSDGGQKSPSKVYDNQWSPHPPDVSNTYDNLENPQSLTKQRNQAQKSLPNTFDHSHGSMETDDDTYNVLSHVGTPVSSPVSKIQPSLVGCLSQNIGDYSILDTTNTVSHPQLRHTKSQPSITPKRCPLEELPGHPLPVSPPRGYDRSSSSSVSSIGSSVCSLEMPRSFQDSQLSMSSTPFDQDYYSSIGEMSPSRQEQSARTGFISDSHANPKQIFPKPRKARTQEQKDEDENQQKANRGSLVSNLRASLVADGFNLKKANQGKVGLRRLSADIIQESDTYAEVDESIKKEEFETRVFRSPSAPIDPNEGIYEDLERTANKQAKSKPKLLVSSKPKIPPRKK